MGTKEALRVFGSFKGKGRAYKGDEFIAEVDYSIKEVEEMLDMELPRGRSSGEVAGQRTIYGIVESPLAKILYGYLGTKLTLHFQDGRVLDFTVTQKLGGDACLIHGLGDYRGLSQ